MFKEQRDIYKKIINNLDLNQINDNFELNKKIGINNKLIIRLNESNKYFSLFDFIFVNEKELNKKIYTEFSIRIWNNKIAEIIRYKLSGFNEYQSIYTLKYGFEIVNKKNQNEANQLFLKLFN